MWTNYPVTPLPLRLFFRLLKDTQITKGVTSHQIGPGRKTVFSRCLQDQSKYSPKQCRAEGRR